MNPEKQNGKFNFWNNKFYGLHFQIQGKGKQKIHFTNANMNNEKR